MDFEKVGNCGVCGAYHVDTQKYNGKYMCYYCSWSNGQDLDVKRHINCMMNALEKRIIEKIEELGDLFEKGNHREDEE